MREGREGEEGGDEALRVWHMWIKGASRDIDCARTRASLKEMT